MNRLALVGALMLALTTAACGKDGRSILAPMDRPATEAERAYHNNYVKQAHRGKCTQYEQGYKMTPVPNYNPRRQNGSMIYGAAPFETSRRRCVDFEYPLGRPDYKVLGPKFSPYRVLG